SIVRNRPILADRFLAFEAGLSELADAGGEPEKAYVKWEAEAADIAARRTAAEDAAFAALEGFMAAAEQDDLAGMSRAASNAMRAGNGDEAFLTDLAVLLAFRGTLREDGSIARQWLDTLSLYPPVFLAVLATPPDDA